MPSVVDGSNIDSRRDRSSHTLVSPDLIDPVIAAKECSNYDPAEQQQRPHREGHSSSCASSDDNVGFIAYASTVEDAGEIPCGRGEEISDFEQYLGVSTAQRGLLLQHKWCRWGLWCGLALLVYCTSLDNSTSYAYQQAAASSFNAYGRYPTLSLLQQLLGGVARFPLAQIANVFGRPHAFTASICLHVIGVVMMALSQNVSMLIGGICFYAAGIGGLVYMPSLIMADLTSSRARGIFFGLLTAPYLINFYAAAHVANFFADKHWRWGFAVAAISVSVAAAPLLFGLWRNDTLAKAELRKVAPQMTAPMILPNSEEQQQLRRSNAARCSELWLKDLDSVGLLLLSAAFILALLPFALNTTTGKNAWTASSTAMLCCSLVCCVTLVWYEWCLAPAPFLARRLLANKDVILSAIIGAADFVSFYMSWTPLYMWAFVVYGWSVTKLTYLSNSQSLALTVAGILCAAYNYQVRRYKWTLVVGAVIRLVGLIMMRFLRNSSTPALLIFLPQIVQGIGGGMCSDAFTVAAQVSVPHRDCAAALAFMNVWTVMGGAVGAAIVASVQAMKLPLYLADFLPYLPADARAAIMQSPLTTLSEYPIGSPARNDITAAWTKFVLLLQIIAICIGTFPVILSPFLSNRKLGQGQNCVEFSDYDAETSAVVISSANAC